MQYRVGLIAIFLGVSLTLFSQDKISVSHTNASIKKVLKSISKDHKIKFLYKKGINDLDDKITISIKNGDVKKTLSKIFSNTNICFKKIGSHYALKTKSEIPASEAATWVMPIQQQSVSVKRTYLLSGFIKDSSSQEELIGAVIYNETLKEGVATNQYGFYSIELPKGEHVLRVSYVGFQTEYVKVRVRSNKSLNFSIKPSRLMLNPIVVQPKEDLNKVFNSERLNLEDQEVNGGIANSDLIRVAENQLGVNSRSEGSGGIHVRGGGVDQNLILLDEAPIYNESHFLGLVSIFNTNAIKKATLYKSGIPSKYGFRLSSVLDLKMKEGNMDHFSFSGSLSPYMADLLVETPLKKDKASLLVSGRSSLVSLLYKKPLKDNFEISRLVFFDVNAKVNLKLGRKDRLYISGYYGGDRIEHDFSNENETDLENRFWGNITSTIRWNHIFGKKLFSNLSVTYSHYNYGQIFSYNAEDYSVLANIRSFHGRYNFNYFLNNKHTIETGIEFIVSGYSPGDFNETFFGSVLDDDDSTVFEYNYTGRFNNTLQTAIYAEDNFKISDKLSMQLGLRLSGFNHFGNGRNLNMVDGFVESEEQEGLYNLNGGISPRFSLNYYPTKSVRLELNYDRMMQYVFLASNNITRSPTDIWIPTTNNLKPGNSHQVSLSYKHFLDSSKYALTVQLFYKRINNVIDFKDNVILSFDENTEFYLEQGIEDAYGLEFSFKKELGDFKFNAQYQYAFAEYQMPTINNGNRYFAPHDKRHTLRLSLNYNLKNKWIFGSQFTLSNGVRTNFPIGVYNVGGVYNTLYGERNSDQMPLYHRLDIFVTWKMKAKKWWRHELTLSVYNAYNQKNAFSYSFEKFTNNVTLNYLMPIIPSLTYKFKFK